MKTKKEMAKFHKKNNGQCRDCGGDLVFDCEPTTSQYFIVCLSCDFEEWENDADADARHLRGM